MKVTAKRLLCILFLAALLIGTLTLQALAESDEPESEALSVETPEESVGMCFDPLTYNTLPDGTLEVTGCESGITDLVIPAFSKGHWVTAIAEGAFNGNTTLQTLTIMPGCRVETIYNAFNGCTNLRSISWTGARYGCLKEITQSFKGCTSLKSVMIPSSVETVGYCSFSDCLSLSSLTFEKDSKLKLIDIYAFGYTGKDNTIVPAVIDTLTLPASLETLKDSAFHCIPVRHFALENGSRLTEIPDGFLAADGDEGTPGVNTEAVGFFDLIKRIFTPYGSTMFKTPEKVAKACDCLVSIDLGEGNSLTRIGVAAFKNQTHLQKLEFGRFPKSESLKIDFNAFVAAGNNALVAGETLGRGIHTVILPANLTCLEESSFKYARIINLKFASGCKLTTIPKDFMMVPGINGQTGGLFDYSNALYLASASLESVDFGRVNSLELLSDQAFFNQVHLKAINFGAPQGAGLVIQAEVFGGAGNNAGLVYEGIDTELCAIQYLVLPANFKYLPTPNMDQKNEYITEYALNPSAFYRARVINLKFADGCTLSTVPTTFMEVANCGQWVSGSKPRQITSAADKVELESARLETIDFGENNSLEYIGAIAFAGQVHLKNIDFGSSTHGLFIASPAFQWAGNNAALVYAGIDEKLGGIDTLVFPKNLKSVEPPKNCGAGSSEDYAFAPAAFLFCNVKHLVFEDNCQLRAIPQIFMSSPHTYNSYGETVVDAMYRAAASLESIDFGENNSLENIGYVAFAGQVHLKSIDFGSSDCDLTIYQVAFQGAGNNAILVEYGVDEELGGIDTLVLPKNLVEIGYTAFLFTRVKNLKLEDGCKLKTIHTDIFSAETQDRNSSNPGAINITDSDRLLSARAYGSAALETIDFGENNNLTTIEYMAFMNQVHLRSIDFGSSETAELTICGTAFMGAGNNACLIDAGLETTLSDGINLELPANLVSLHSDSFLNARIKNLSFADNCKLTSVPDGFLCVRGADGDPKTHTAELEKKVSQNILDACNSLETIDFGKNNSLTTIGSAFRNQQHLKAICFRKDAESETLTLKSGAFSGITLDTLILPSNIALDGAGQFKKAKIDHLIFADGCKLTKLTDGFMTRDYLDPNDKPTLKSVYFGKDSALTTIGAGVFAGCAQLTKLDLSGTKVTTIEKGAFNDCGLVEVYLPDTLTTLNNGAFQGLTSLKTLYIGSDCDLTKLEGGVFSGCAQLTIVSLQNSKITNIDDSVKQNPNLKTVIFPETLQSVTWSAAGTDSKCPFYGCGNVNELHFFALDPSGYSFSSNVFKFLNAAGTVYVPAGTNDTNIQLYKSKLTAAGLTFDATHWKIAERVGVTGVTLDQTELEMKPGETLKLNATVEPTNATVQDVIWSTDNSYILRVDQAGNVTAGFPGKATVTVTTVEGGKTATFTATVRIPYVKPTPAPHNPGGKPTGGTTTGGTSAYTITVNSAKNGTVTAPSTAKSGATVTVTVNPDKGYTLETVTAKTATTTLTLTKVSDNVFTFTMPSANVTVSASFMEDNTMLNYFVDVKASDYFYDAVLWAADKGVTSGVDSLHFAPDGLTTRAQMVTFLWRAAGSPEPATATCPFTDVDSSAYYYKAVLWAVEKGITKGITDTTFAPNATVTRAQAVTFLWRYAGSIQFANMTANGPAPSPYTDVATDAYYYNAVLWAKAEGITTGSTATTFAPDAGCTRAQIVTFLYRNFVK